MTGRLLCGAGVGAIAATSAFAQSISDEIVVTAQRQEQSVQDVPIAVSAFGGEDLGARQLETFQDIQFNIPNFAFSKSQFTASSISIRGIGALAVGASTEPSTSIHMNDFFLQSPRLFETEFFDVERLEILRGPQGTLFGRNATGGVVNVITRKA
ncbi:MAG: TonB-dependent receptor, partial [Parvularculaceae bacterium]|nr:TonB-dependent receptor [Parvularculaceae bacterium]